MAEELNVTAAARRAHVAQPAMSQAISKVERQLGTALFDRGGGRLRLTAAGRLLVPEARALVERAREVSELVPRAHGEERSVLRLGAIASAVSGLLPRALPGFRADRPDVMVQVYEMGQARQLAAVHAGDVDLGICRVPAGSGDGVQVQPLADEPLVCAIPAEHPLASDAVNTVPVPLLSLQGDDMVGFPRAMAPVAFDTVVGVCMRAGFSPRFVQEASNDQAILGLVSCGLGIALVPQMSTRISLPGVVYRPVAESYAVTPLSVVVASVAPPEAALQLREALAAAAHRAAAPSEAVDSD